MANMTQEYKEQKIAHMKNLKRMQLEHETITKKQVGRSSSGSSSTIITIYV
jgi:hypothetical protein